jgi:hypothetical protein
MVDTDDDDASVGDHDDASDERMPTSDAMSIDEGVSSGGSNQETARESSPYSGAVFKRPSRSSGGSGNDTETAVITTSSIKGFGRPLLSSLLTPIPRHVVLSATSSDQTVGVDVQLTDWTAHSTKRIYAGMRWPGGRGPFILKVVAPGYTADRLRDECDTLGQLKDLPVGVPKSHGLFKWHGARDDRLVLATSYCGRPARSWAEFTLGQR